MFRKSSGRGGYQYGVSGSHLDQRARELVAIPRSDWLLDLLHAQGGWGGRQGKYIERHLAFMDRQEQLLERIAVALEERNQAVAVGAQLGASPKKRLKLTKPGQYGASQLNCRVRRTMNRREEWGK